MDLKLAIVSHQSLSTLGGISVHIRQLVEALVKLGVDVEVIVPTFGLRQSPSYPFHVTPIELSSRLQTIRTLEYSYKVYRYLAEKRKRFDAVHGSQWSMFFPCINKHELDLPLITKFHGTYRFGTFVRFMLYKMRSLIYDMGSFLVMPLYDHTECEVAEKSDGLIFIHGSVKREVEVITHNKLCRNMCIIHNGVDAKNFKPRDVSELKHKYGLSEKDKVLLFVGRLEPLKGVHTFIRVAKRLLRDYPSLKIMIVGDGHPSYIRVLKELAKSKDNFIFTGWVEHDKLPEIYCLADIFVSPSPYSSGNNLLEAMACGKPVVAVRGLGFEELIEHGKTGFIVDSMNIEYNLERCLRSVLYNEELLSHIGKNARSFVEENLSWEKTALKTVKFIQLLLKGEQSYEEDISLAPN